MLETSARLLALLGLLQTPRTWSAAELTARLGVGERTVRKDVERLRALDYPIDAVRGPAGGYRLGEHGKLPPLLLDDEEAVAVAVGLQAVTAVRGIEEASALALAKLEHVLPSRLRRRVRALHDSTSTGPANTATNVADPAVDAALLTELAVAVRDSVGIRFAYRDDEHAEVEPYRLVSWQQRWYLVARERPTREWRSYRADWMRLKTPGGARFSPDPLPGGDYTAFVLREVAFAGWSVHARIEVDAPAEEVLARINPTVGVVETVDDRRCVLVTGGDSLEIVAVWIGMLGLDFHVTEPPELVEHIRVLATRYAGALPG
ncbi:helix-turn-helix transcriptional regulator [Pseudonocardia sichuanensis]|uniref:Putative DNA-binding transcriptional regulator YafY n=1 Tax=Pseudonocardia kunmingensis TaxID=630975 RepID=A0A543E2T6_9PSEU|nr:WYL domain-containing protein [Pseudonocardia kunmingensis]TQM15910.1 putative DNA-binding transcriptional regulator YafY [Pseudonocardia kunmingensis]